MSERRSTRTANRSSTPTAKKGAKSVGRRATKAAVGEREALGSEQTDGSRASGSTRRTAIAKTKRKLAQAPRQPDADALRLAADVGSRREAPCNIRKSFARRLDASQDPPVLAQLVGAGAGRAAEPRVKLVLTLLFLARENDGWTVETVAAATWALLFGLHDPEKLGAARITAAIKALDEAEIIVADRKRGREPKLLVRHERGDGSPWTSPVGQKGKSIPVEDRYAQLDSDFWANGWITLLSSRAVAALVILLDATWDQKGTDKAEEQVRDDLTINRTKALRWWHITEEQLTDQYALSRDMFDRGVNELVEWQLVESRKRAAVERTSWGSKRWYRELRVRLEVLHTPAADIAAGKQVARVAHSSEDPLGTITLSSTSPGDTQEGE